MNLLETEPAYSREVRARRHVRIRRAKQFLRPLPRKATLHRWPILKRFAETARKRPYLWSFRKREVSIALYIGFVITFLPLVGIQLILAFVAALTLRANLPVIMGTQLVTNLATIWAIYPALNMLGNRILGFLGIGDIESRFGQVAVSTTIGGLVAGIALAFIFDVIYRIAFYQAKKGQINLKRILKK